MRADGRAGHQDIREIFLNVPIPQDELESYQVAEVLGDSGQRKLLLDKTDFTLGDNVLDQPNGYLRINFMVSSERVRVRAGSS